MLTNPTFDKLRALGCAFRRIRTLSPEFSNALGRRPRSGRREMSVQPLMVTSFSVVCGAVWHVDGSKRASTARSYGSCPLLRWPLRAS